ncbi:MAG: VOC family protein, partial [Alphaproteobacteria bacterium]
MTMIDHLSVGVPDIEEAKSFYDGLLATLGCHRLAATDSFAAYGTAAVEFLVMLPYDKKDASAGNGTH